MRNPALLLKQYLPKSLFWRAFLILVIPILILNIVVAAVFIQRLYDRVTAQMAGAVARELNFAIEAVEGAESAEAARSALARMGVPFGFEMALDPAARVEPEAVRAFYDLTGSVIAKTLRERLERPMSLDFVAFPKHLDARIATSKGVLRVLVPRDRVNAANPHQLLVWVSATALVLTVVATMFLSNQVRPIRNLARAASAFGRGRSLPFRPSGAEEVRRAGQAFLDMRARIERQIGQRTLMLSGVSHDLRTPLTRMKLALAVAEESPETTELTRDVVEMERMLDAFLDFARGQRAEAPEPVDAVALAEEVAEDTRRKGTEITVFARIEAAGEHSVVLRRAAVKRCLTNLIDNAATYGGRVSLATHIRPRALDFVIEDGGPGIPPEKREVVFRPFTRLDASRNQDLASGVGLGLSIALDVARSHGGGLTLDESPRMGGLRATVSLPR